MNLLSFASEDFTSLRFMHVAQGSTIKQTNMAVGICTTWDGSCFKDTFFGVDVCEFVMRLKLATPMVLSI